MRWMKFRLSNRIENKKKIKNMAKKCTHKHKHNISFKDVFLLRSKNKILIKKTSI